MNFEGEIKVRTSRSAVFDKLNDVRFLASCIEGIEELQEVDSTHYTAVLETKIAYFKFKFNVTVEITEREAPNYIVAKSVGTPLGVVGRLTSTSTVRLREEDDETTINYAVDVSLAGKLGSIGQPVLRAKAKELERQFAANLRSAFDEAGSGILS